MSEFNYKKYVTNNPLLKEGKVEDYAEMILSAAKGLDDPLKSAIDLIGNYRDNPSELPKEIDKGFFVSNYVDIIFALEDQYRKMNEEKGEKKEVRPGVRSAAIKLGMAPDHIYDTKKKVNEVEDRTEALDKLKDLKDLKQKATIVTGKR